LDYRSIVALSATIVVGGEKKLLAFSETFPAKSDIPRTARKTGVMPVSKKDLAPKKPTDTASVG
jgi:hypothetical protein